MKEFWNGLFKNKFVVASGVVLATSFAIYKMTGKPQLRSYIHPLDNDDDYKAPSNAKKSTETLYIEIIDESIIKTMNYISNFIEYNDENLEKYREEIWKLIKPNIESMIIAYEEQACVNRNENYREWVAAVRMMIGGGKLPRESTCPFADIIREDIFNSVSDNYKRAIRLGKPGRHKMPKWTLTYCILQNNVTAHWLN